MRAKSLSSPSENGGLPKGGLVPLWRRTASKASQLFPQKMRAPGEVF